MIDAGFDEIFFNLPEVNVFKTPSEMPPGHPKAQKRLSSEKQKAHSVYYGDYTAIGGAYKKIALLRDQHPPPPPQAACPFPYK